MKRALTAFGLVSGLFLSSIASAETSLSITGRGQQSLGVKVTDHGVLLAVCASGACSAENGVPLGLGSIEGLEIAKATVAAIDLEQGKKVARIDVPSTSGGALAILVAPPLTGAGDAPLVLWHGFVDHKRGEEGESTESFLSDEIDPKSHAHRVIVGERRDDVTICGRPASLSAKRIDPATMTLKAASVQSLSQDDRDKATKISATKTSAPLAQPIARLLKATGASSAIDRKITTATDGDRESVWSARAGGGAGEFLTLGSSPDVAIDSLEIVVRPKEAVVEDGAAPKSFFLATRDKLFRVAMPDDAWKSAGASYEIKLPSPIKTECVAVVLDESYASNANARVSIAEVTAHTPFDASSIEGLVGALAGGGDRAMAAAALLARAGTPGFHAVGDGYAKLDSAGKMLALGVLDAAPCAEQTPFFAARLAEVTSAPLPTEAERRRAADLFEEDPIFVHARDRVRRCASEAAPLLAKLIADSNERTQTFAAGELAMLRPGAAVPALLDAIPKANDATRQALRAALAHAATSERALPVLKDEISPAKLGARPEIAQIDFLRALGPASAKLDGAAAALAKLAVPTASFRTRYLLEAPAADLARAGDANALAFLRASLKSDPDAHVRARAAEVAISLPALSAEIVAAIDDSDARVREAAVATLAHDGRASGGAPEALAKRLTDDDWTFVRAGSARALAAMPAGAVVDHALSTAIDDKSVEVRSNAIDALGAHGAKAFAEPVKARWQDSEENLEVRARAVIALGRMCDRDDLDAFTKLALKTKAPVDDVDRRLGGAAVVALGYLHPADLDRRLAPLLQKDAPVGAREAAKSALAANPSCGSR